MKAPTALEPLFGLPALLVMALLGLNSVKVTSGGQSRLVSHESMKERVLDIPPQQCITRDNEVDAVVYWQLLEHARAYYAVDNLQAAMVNLVLTQIRAEMGKLDLDQTFTTRSEVNETLLKELDQATAPWGVKVTRVELRDIQPSRGVQQAMEQQMTAEREKRAAILRSEGERESQLNAARGRADAATRLAEAMQANPQAGEAIRLLLAGDWMAMGEQMANAPAGSVLMVDPQSPAALVTALRGLQERGGSSPVSEQLPTPCQTT